jgi:hypothetical protein
MANPGALTPSVRTVVAVCVPEVPVIVTPYDPRCAFAPTLKVSWLPVVDGLALHAALIPAGRPKTVKFTFPVKPLCPTTVIVAEAELPGLMVRVLAELESSKPLFAGGGARASIRGCPAGLPQPVTRS